MALFDVRSEEASSEASEIQVSEKMQDDWVGDDVEWVISIKDNLEQALRADAISNQGKLCIYKIPYYMRGKFYMSYSPETVSLGPYHNGESQLQSMECHKWRAVYKVLKRNNYGIKMFLDAMREIEEKARACYEGPISMKSNEFIEMLVLDGCFVLEILRGRVEGFAKLGYERNDSVFTMRGLMHSIQRDMVLLENQLPVFVLDRLLQLQPGTQNETGLVAQLAVLFFDPLIPRDELLTRTDQSKLDKSLQKHEADPLTVVEELHCLDVFRRSLLLPKLDSKRGLERRRRWYWGSRVVDKRQQQMIHRVTELREAGIKFRRRETDQFWDISFKDGYLEIPKLFIHDGTKSLFLNLIAFEQCHMDLSNDITSYIVFMDNLLDSAEDVSYLHSCGILEHWLENDSIVADLFNQLGQGIIFNIKDSYLYQLSVDANVYYHQHNKYYRKWNVWEKTLKEKYFDSPWAYISFFAALILLLLTASQTYFAGYDYFKPASEPSSP